MPVTIDDQANASGKAFRAISDSVRGFYREAVQNSFYLKSELFAKVKDRERDRVRMAIGQYLSNHCNWIAACAEASSAVCRSGNIVCLSMIARPAVESATKFVHAANIDRGFLSLIRREANDILEASKAMAGAGASEPASAMRNLANESLLGLEDIQMYHEDGSIKQAIEYCVKIMSSSEKNANYISKYINAVHSVNYHRIIHGNIKIISMIRPEVVLHNALLGMDFSRILYMRGFSRVATFEDGDAWMGKYDERLKEFSRAMSLLGVEFQ